MNAPVVFISYSHDSQAHKSWVMSLATRLRGDGIDVIFDLWELGPGHDLPHFMETSISKSSRILMICTDNYVQKANLGAGGVGYEKMIVTGDLLSKIDNNIVIPVLRGTKETPTFLKSKLYIDLSSLKDFEIEYEKLLRELLGSPLFVKPPLGTAPNFSEAKAPTPTLRDPVDQLLIAAEKIYDRSDNNGYLEIAALHRVMGSSKLFFDYALDLAKQREMIHFSGDKEFIKILPAGRSEMLKLTFDKST